MFTTMEDILSNYPDFFTSIRQWGAQTVELNFAGYAKEEVKAHFKGDKLIVIGHNDARGKSVRTVLLDRRLTYEDVKIKYSCGLITVSVEKPQEKKAEILIE